MADYTENLNLKKPARTENYNVADQNGNMDIIDASIDEINNKFTETKIGDNLLDETKAVDGYLNAQGQIVPRPDLDWLTSDFIDVSDLEGETIYFYALGINYTPPKRVNSGVFFFTKYNASKQVISQTTSVGGGSYTVEENVKYIRFCWHKNDRKYFSVRTENSFKYRPYLVAIGLANSNFASEISLLNRENKINVTYDEAKVIETSGYISTLSSGDTGYKITDFVDISNYKKIKINGSSNLKKAICYFYDEEQNPYSCEYVAADSSTITTVHNAIIEVPKGAKYVVVAGRNELPEIFYYDMATKIWEGKKWVVVGDSLTEVNRRTTMHYHDYIANETGIEVVNMGHSGTGYKKSEDEDKAFYQRVEDIPTDSDVVTIFGSGNDLSLIASLGTPTDTGTDTICGCINTTIDNIIEIMPAVSLGIVAPTPWVGNQPTLDDSNSMGKYTEALRKICKIRSIPFLDLYHCSNLRPWTEEGRNTCYTKDEGNGVHPDETGHKLIAPRFKAFLETLLF